MNEPMLDQRVQNSYLAASQDEQLAASRRLKWAVVLGARLFLDGNQWCALYGDNLQDGVCGFGDTPAGAIDAFEAAMNESVNRPVEVDDMVAAMERAQGFSFGSEGSAEMRRVLRAALQEAVDA